MTQTEMYAEQGHVSLDTYEGVETYGRRERGRVNSGNASDPHTVRAARFYFAGLETWPHCMEPIYGLEFNPPLPDWAAAAHRGETWMCPRSRIDDSEFCDWHTPEPDEDDGDV